MSLISTPEGESLLVDKGRQSVVLDQAPEAGPLMHFKPLALCVSSMWKINSHIWICNGLVSEVVDEWQHVPSADQ